MLYTDGTYLVADKVRELTAFANQIDLPQQFRHSAAFIPSCRLPAPYNQQAIEAGAKLVDTVTLYQVAQGQNKARSKGGAAGKRS